MSSYRHLMVVALAVVVLSCGTATDSGTGSPDASILGGPDRADVGDGIELHLDFDHPLTLGTRRLFDSGAGWTDAEIVESEPGTLTVAAGQGPGSTAASFPARCARLEGCPHALVQLPDDDRLNPGGSDFAFGARVRLAPDQTAVGSNIVQKGRYDTVGGQWKLQVDGLEGQPSCVVQGEVGESRETVKLKAEQSIADDEWHEVSCAIEDDRLTITVDGIVKTVRAEIESVRNESDLHIGASGPADTDDQFHGVIDEVRFCLGTCG